MDLMVDTDATFTQLHNSYIVVPTNRGFILVNQQLAHERILYERFTASSQGKKIAAQQSLFPVTLTLSTADAVLLEELRLDLNDLGYLVEPFGQGSFVIQGTPADLAPGYEKQTIENLLEQYKHFSSELKFSRREKITRSLALQQSVKAGTSLGQKEMQSLVEELFQCSQPNMTANGSPTYIEFKKDYLEKLFTR
ncbi:MAG: hypothetical protein IPP79_13320 [Chitinophagaceae bacterium]|nr:hypothetical protein [Chitinophagaceae bacterium]